MTARLRLVAATANPAKLAEIVAILGDRVELLPRPPAVPDIVEDADTLEGNAELKARAIFEATGLPSLADDTGLEVAALEGAPGVRSARYAGEEASDHDNVAKLLAELSDATDRRAWFHTVAMVVGTATVIAHGQCAGTISRDRRGTNGFGYDPVFVPDDGDGRTFAEMTGDEKHAMSHRGRAFRALARALVDS